MTEFLIIILLTSALVCWVMFIRQSKQLKAKDSELSAFQTANQQLTHEAVARELQLQSEIDQLAQYRPIVDSQAYAQQIRVVAEEKATEIVSRAEQQADSLRVDAIEELKQAKGQSKEIRDKATATATRTQERADSILLDATREASRIVVTANQRAEEIAGEALTASRNATALESTIQALKNTINGYGTEYLLPAYALLDELADEFSFEQAGVELKSARDHTRRMMTERLSAVCDYVENLRSTSAVDFVTDAFNGKVDTILASFKTENYGISKQKIKSAYAIVNQLGKPFRNARITPEYLQARLEELHWATVAYELKIKEKEEQRIIKEQIREEEKARRDFERAQREAAKQEDTIQKAIDKVQQQAAKASAEQQAAFEAQLSELQAKLQAAHEKNQRALSMAQQTKSGHVYIISNVGSFGEHVYKIGMTRRLEPLDRIKELGDASVPFEFDVHAMLFSEDAPALERSLHRHFLTSQVNKVNPRKEFFRVDLSQVKTEIESLGIETKWTLSAAAREYRESLAVEQALANNTLDKAEWEKFQLENEPTELESEEQDS